MQFSCRVTLKQLPRARENKEALLLPYPAIDMYVLACNALNLEPEFLPTTASSNVDYKFNVYLR